MRRILSFIWVLIILTGCKIYDGDLVIQTTADLEVFAAREYTYVKGDVKIIDTNLTNLDGLNKLTTIKGNLYITGNTVLNNINGLSNLDTIDLELHIKDNEELTTLHGLNNLTSVGMKREQHYYYPIEVNPL